MGNEIVERARVAFVLAASAFEYDVRLRELTDDETRGLMRAAIAALREPSEAMIEAGNGKLMRGPVGALLNDPQSVWTSMIDTALTEGNE